MDLELRDATVSDLDRFLPFVSPLLCDPLQHDELRAMWSEIIDSKSGVATMASDLEPSSAIIHFAFCVFVSDGRANEYHQCRYPLIARRMLSDWIADERPFLDADEVACANAGSGLNLVVTHYGGRRDHPQAPIANYESARRALCGWNLRSYTAEMSSDPEHGNREWGRSLGYRVLDYSPDVLRAAGIPEDRAPLVWAATRRDAKSNPGYAVALIFNTFSKPRLQFTRLEQDILSLALHGATDASIAHIAGFSESAIKKHFRTLYEKVHAAGVFDGVADAGAARPTRGVELRRHLLTYLREHPEELRPYRHAQRRRGATPSSAIAATYS